LLYDLVQAVQNVPVVQVVKNRIERFELLERFEPALSCAEDCPHFFARRPVFFCQAGIAGHELDPPQ
jgi:hypothetical protein